MGEQEISKWTNSLQDHGQKGHFKIHLNVTSSQGSDLEKKEKCKHNWYFSLVLHFFLALVNILLQNTKQDGAAHKCIKRTGTEISVKEIQREGVTIGVQINSFTEAVLQQPVQIS